MLYFSPHMAVNSTMSLCDSAICLGFMGSFCRAWWTVTRTQWIALGPAWCRGWALRWPCFFSCCKTSAAHPLLWLQLLPSRLGRRAVGAGAGPRVPICTKFSLICETETLPVTWAKSARPVTAPNLCSNWIKLPALLKTSKKRKKAPPFPWGDKSFFLLYWKLLKYAPQGNASPSV